MSAKPIAVLLAALTTGAVFVPATPALASARHFANCTAMHRSYPHGVGTRHARDHVTSGRPVTTFTRNDALYAANTSMDRDRDHVACEKR